MGSVEMLTKNFAKWEFACKHCGLSNPDPSLVQALQKYRDILGVPIKITSGGRCQAIEGRWPDSQHMVSKVKTSKAADCIALGINLLDMYHVALQISDFMNGGIGIYPQNYNVLSGFLHLDARGYFARWSRIDGEYKKHQEGLDWIHMNLLASNINAEMRPIKQGQYIYKVPYLIG